VAATTSTLGAARQKTTSSWDLNLRPILGGHSRERPPSAASRPAGSICGGLEGAHSSSSSAANNKQERARLIAAAEDWPQAAAARQIQI
jgi:hypothetical protein